MYKQYDFPKKSGPKKDVGHARTLSNNFKTNNNIYCTCKNVEKKTWMQNFCYKCNKQINNNPK